MDRMTRALTSNASRDLITDERQTILDLNSLDLAERLRSGALDPVEVLEAYQVKDIKGDKSIRFQNPKSILIILGQSNSFNPKDKLHRRLH